MAQPQREFSAEYLQEASRPTVELVADALAVNAYDRVEELIAQFQTETGGMLFGYLAWPKCMARRVREWRGEPYWDEMNKAAMQMLADEIPPARATFSRWEDNAAALVNAARNEDADAISTLFKQWHADALSVHDSYMNYAAVLVSEVARRCGQDAMQQVLTEIMDPEAMDMQPETPFRQRVETLIRYTRFHLLPFRLVEDDEKITFIASPCPSGGRQLLAGLYERGKPGELISGKSPVTYGRQELPAYCCHESALEAASIQRFGHPLFVVEPSAQLGHLPCHVHVYKDASQIPDRYYRRVGLHKRDGLIASD